MTRALPLLVFLSSAAAAASAPIEGVVLEVSPAEMIVDLGRAQGVQPGSVLQVFRRLVVVHPATGARIEDRFPIGAVRVAERGLQLSVVRNYSALRRRPERSDIVVFVPPLEPSEEPATGLPQATRPAPGTPPPALDPAAVRRARERAEREELEAATERALGTQVEERMGLYSAYLAAHRDAPGAEAVRSEIAQLRKVRMTEAALERATRPPERRLAAEHLPPARTRAGAPLDLAVRVEQLGWVEAVLLLARRAGEPRYQTVQMLPAGDHYFRAAAPPELLAAPGTLEYAVEVILSGGERQFAVGHAEQPATVPIEPVPQPRAQPGGVSHATLRYEVANFYLQRRPGDGPDQYQQLELGFRHAIAGVPPFAGFRVGGGNVDGRRGFSDLEEAGGRAPGDVPLQTINLSYGFAELEVDLHPWVGLAARVIGGNHFGGSGARVAAGLEGRLRIGTAEGSRLVLGGSVLQDLGTQGAVDVVIAAFQQIPIQAGIVVTSFPFGNELGVRLTGQVGWRPVEWLTLSLVIGWNLRTINHHGVTLGGGVAFDW